MLAGYLSASVAPSDAGPVVGLGAGEKRDCLKREPSCSEVPTSGYFLLTDCCCSGVRDREAVVGVFAAGE